MNKYRLVFPLVLLLLMGCNGGINEKVPIPVKNMSIQELDNEDYIKEQDKKGSKKIAENYKLDNDNFTVVDDKKITACDDMENIRLENYVIETVKRQKTLDKIEHEIIIYSNKDDKCQLLTSKKGGYAIRAVGYNNLLFFEEQQTNDPKNKRRLYKYDGDDITLIKEKMLPINNMVFINGKLLVSYGEGLAVLDNVNNQLIDVTMNTKQKVWAISAYQNDLYIVFEDKKSDSLSVNHYGFNMFTQIRSESDLNLLSSRKMQFENPSLRQEISQTISKQTKDYTVFDSKMICKANYEICEVVVLEGETIQDVVDNFVLYNSDRSYISDFNRNTKQAISSLMINYFDIENERLLFKIYSANNKSYKFLEYELKKDFY